MEEVEAGPWRLACYVPDTCRIQKTSFSLKCAEDNESENKGWGQGRLGSLVG